jgi:putative ABC transport system permease protein
MRTPFILVGRHLRAHWLRTALTVTSLVVALYLFCFLISLVTTLDDAVKHSRTDRVIVESAVSLFVSLPQDYQPKIVAVPGVKDVTKFQWFGGLYQDTTQFFAQFGIDHTNFFSMYEAEFAISEGPGGVTGPAARTAVIEAMAADRRACIIGEGLARDFGWKVGDTVPLIGTIFPLEGGKAWEFNVVGYYQPLKANIDDRTMFFRYDYLDEMLKAQLASGPPGVGTFAVNVAPGHDSAQVIADIDRLFENGPQVTMTTTEAAFQATFVAMMGNLPLFVGTIGGAVVFAVVFSVINTMLMSARQRTHEFGILKALGFRDSAVAVLLLTESLLLCLIGGGLGVLLALVTDESLRKALGSNLPTYSVRPDTVWLGFGVAALVGLIAGLGPALAASRMRPTEALRSEG